MFDREPDQCAVVRSVELSAQGRHMALDRSHRHEQPSGDLLVGQVVPEQIEHLAFAWRDHPEVHPASVPSTRPLRRIRSDIRGNSGCAGPLWTRP